MEQITNRNTRAKSSPLTPLVLGYPFSPATIRAQYCDWLSEYPFHWYLTLTFENTGISEYKAHETLRYFVRTCEREMYGKHRAGRTHDYSLSMVVAMEKRYGGDGLHFHCLIQAPKELGKLTRLESLPPLLNYLWIQAGGGVQFDCQEIRRQKDIYKIANYSTKQIFKNKDCLDMTWFRKRTG